MWHKEKLAMLGTNVVVHPQLTVKFIVQNANLTFASAPEVSLVKLPGSFEWGPIIRNVHYMSIRFLANGNREHKMIPAWYTPLEGRGEGVVELSKSMQKYCITWLIKWELVSPTWNAGDNPGNTRTPFSSLEFHKWSKKWLVLEESKFYFTQLKNTKYKTKGVTFYQGKVPPYNLSKLT